ncbi:MAG TPA: glycosyltransferase family 39 protein [Thermoanaerobaculia bacterium]|nr:glycosyltransferase family 39 protein [Thermoanaerobaculia bacterium]
MSEVLHPSVARPAPDASVRAPAARRPLARAVGRWVVRHYRLSFGLVLVLMAVNVFLRLDGTAVNDSDEARYGVSAYEMAQGGSPIVTTYAERPEYWNLKPPLGYWAMALTFRLLGVTPWTLRLPSALFALASVALTMLFAGRWLSRRAAILSGLVLATAHGFLSNHGARSGDLDSALTLLLLLAALQVAHLDRSPRRRWTIALLGLLFGLAFLVKSFAILPMVLAAAFYVVYTGAWRRSQPLPAILSLLAFFLPIGGWALARYRADGTAYFLRRMVQEDLLARSTRVIDHVRYSPLGYVDGLGDRLAPWPELIVVAVVAALLVGRPRPWRRLRQGVMPLLLLWTVVPLLLFSVSKTQHHWYMDPAYPALAMLSGVALLGLLRRSSSRRRTAALLGLIVLPLVLCEARFLTHVLHRDRVPPSQHFLRALGRRPPELGSQLYAGFHLNHVERFLLEAVDGFRVVEAGGSGGPTVDAPVPRGALVLLRKGHLPGVGPGPGSTYLAGTRRYALYRSGGRGPDPATYGLIPDHFGARLPARAAIPLTDEPPRSPDLP